MEAKVPRPRASRVNGCLPEIFLMFSFWNVYIYTWIKLYLKKNKCRIVLLYFRMFFPSKIPCNTKQTRTKDLSQTPTHCSHYNKSSQLDPQESWKIWEFKSLSSNPSPQKKTSNRISCLYVQGVKSVQEIFETKNNKEKRLGSAEKWGGQAWFAENNSLPIPTIQPTLSKRIWTFPGNIWHRIYYIIGSRVCISSRWQTQPKYLL